jgi:hypothetical protein
MNLELDILYHLPFGRIYSSAFIRFLMFIRKTGSSGIEKMRMLVRPKGIGITEDTVHMISPRDREVGLLENPMKVRAIFVLILSISHSMASIISVRVQT